MKWFLPLLVLLLLNLPAALAGGTNGVFSRMDGYVRDMEANQSVSAEEAKAWRDKIGELREKVDVRIRQNGGGMNPYQDKDFYDEIDSYGQPLFEQYQASKKPR